MIFFSKSFSESEVRKTILGYETSSIGMAGRFYLISTLILLGKKYSGAFLQGFFLIIVIEAAVMKLPFFVHLTFPRSDKLITFYYSLDVKAPYRMAFSYCKIRTKNSPVFLISSRIHFNSKAGF